jgi:hypothetical protein
LIAPSSISTPELLDHAAVNVFAARNSESVAGNEENGVVRTTDGSPSARLVNTVIGEVAR